MREIFRNKPSVDGRHITPILLSVLLGVLFLTASCGPSEPERGPELAAVSIPGLWAQVEAFAEKHARATRGTAVFFDKQGAWGDFNGDGNADVLVRYSIEAMGGGGNNGFIFGILFVATDSAFAYSASDLIGDSRGRQVEEVVLNDYTIEMHVSPDWRDPDQTGSLDRCVVSGTNFRCSDQEFQAWVQTAPAVAEWISTH